MRRGPCPAGFSDGSHAGRSAQRRYRGIEGRCHAGENGPGCGGIGRVFRAEALGRPGEDRVRRAGVRHRRCVVRRRGRGGRDRGQHVADAARHRVDWPDDGGRSDLLARWRLDMRTAPSSRHALDRIRA